jgi:uncharacterized protein YlxP (DUF503 family)
MHVVTCVITLQLYGVDSLKAKRRVLKSILTRLQHHFNVATAEIDNHDTWHTSVICLVSIGNDPGYLHGLMEKTVTWIESNCRDAIIERYTIEYL